MNFTQLERKARDEALILSDYLECINDARTRNPKGCDLSIPDASIHFVVSYCDLHGIPVYHVCDNTVSTAATYGQLVVHERAR